jgi:hypothetical protein
MRETSHTRRETATDMSTVAPSLPQASNRPWWLVILGGFSVLLGVVTFLPQWYYIFYYVNAVVASPHANILGQIWYWYGTQIDTSALSKDSGTLAGAVEDAIMLGPLYIISGIGLLRLSPWVQRIGLLTGGMSLYAILYFILGDTFNNVSSVENLLIFWLTTLPYLAYAAGMIVTTLVRRDLFTPSAPAA